MADPAADAQPLAYTEQPPKATFSFPHPPTEPLTYPIAFGNAAAADSDHSEPPSVTLFSSLSWLLPLFELADFIVAKDTRAHLAAADAAEAAEAKAHPDSRAVRIRRDYPDAASALRLLPLFQKFFTEEEKMIPQHTEKLRSVASFTFPTPRGDRTITRSLVEGDARAKFAKPVHAGGGGAGGGGGGAQLAAASVTNTTAVFSLLPGHNNFLVHYEREKLGLHGRQAQQVNAFISSHAHSNNSDDDEDGDDSSSKNGSGGGGRGGGGAGRRLPPPSVTVENDNSAFSLFTYLELDQLRFAFTAVKELVEDSKTFNANDGSLSLLARRDIKKNSLSSPFCLHPKATAGTELDKTAAAEEANSSKAAAAAAAGGGGGGRKGRATNIITAPRQDLIDERREIAQKRFLKSDLEEECQRRWPHTPVSKALVFLFEEKAEADLTPAEIQAMGLDERRINMNKAKNRRGQRFYLGIAELPLLNKKGGAARFRAARLWNTKKDAESAAAEAALTALRNFK